MVDLPQPFLSSSLQSDKENVDEKKIGGAISFGKAIGALLQSFGRSPQAFLARADGEWEEKVWGVPLSTSFPPSKDVRLMLANAVSRAWEPRSPMMLNKYLFFI
jgi:hypothetical protein